MHKKYLLQALEIAKTREGYCTPNPAVGAVLIKDDQLIASGVHWAAGHQHAEVDALSKVKKNATKNSILYVTLEPCAHYGKTPPCTEAIIANGIQRVVFGFRDPHINPSQGQQQLKAAGVACLHFPLPEIDSFYRHYAYWCLHQRPWVCLKLAFSIDYKIGHRTSGQTQITGSACRSMTQIYRQRSDAILTTCQTITQDDPQLNARLPHEVISKPLAILDSHLALPRSATVFNTAKSIIIYHRNNLRCNNEVKTEAVPVSFNQQGLSIEAILKDLGERGIHKLWVEAGARLFRSFYENNWANEIIFYRSKRLLGPHAISAFPGRNPLKEHHFDWEILGEDEIARLTIS